MGEAAGDADLAHLLAEAAAGSPEAESRLAARLRSELEALLSQRLSGPEAASVADAGELVQRHWRLLEQQAVSPEGVGPKNGTGKKSKGGRKATPGAKGRKGAKRAPGVEGAEGDAGGMNSSPASGGDDSLKAGLAAAAVTSPLFPLYIEQAAVEMQRLVRELAARADPQGPAMATLAALDALEHLDPPLARVARLRWFAGLAPGAIADLLGEGEAEIERRWLKARAFLVAATRGFVAPLP